MNVTATEMADVCLGVQPYPFLHDAARRMASEIDAARATIAQQATRLGELQTIIDTQRQTIIRQCDEAKAGVMAERQVSEQRVQIVRMTDTIAQQAARIAELEAVVVKQEPAKIFLGRDGRRYSTEAAALAAKEAK